MARVYAYDRKDNDKMIAADSSPRGEVLTNPMTVLILLKRSVTCPRPRNRVVKPDIGNVKARELPHMPTGAESPEAGHASLLAL